MKTNFFLTSFLVASVVFIAQAQTLNDTTSFVTDKMFELAWENYPQNRIKEHEASKAMYKLKETKWNWTKDVVAQFNLNEANLDPNSTGGVNIYYPKYVLGLRLNLGTFVLTPLEVKQAREDYHAAQSDVELQRVLIKNEVAKRIYAYKLAKLMLKVKTQALEESHTLQNIAKQKFQSGELTFEEYNKTNISHLDMVEAKYTAESVFYSTKNDLETIIGVKLETLKLPSSF